MTEKKERILQVALELFANHGYDAVSTNKIARVAEVSEGLIFRHFKNKKGLLDAITKDTEEKLEVVFAPLNSINTPKEVLRYAIAAPFAMDESSYSFWRLQFKLKWEEEYYKPEKMLPLVEKLTWAFEQLEYAQPRLEAEFLVHSLDTFAILLLREGKEKCLPYKSLLEEKYGL